jgi:hypothetical protein
VERAAAAGAGLILDIDDLLDPFEMGGQRSTVGLARAFAPGLGRCCITRGLRAAQRGLDIFEGELELWTCNGFVPVTDLIMLPWLQMRVG